MEVVKCDGVSYRHMCVAECPKESQGNNMCNSDGYSERTDDVLDPVNRCVEQNLYYLENTRECTSLQNGLYLDTQHKTLHLDSEITSGFVNFDR